MQIRVRGGEGVERDLKMSCLNWKEFSVMFKEHFLVSGRREINFSPKLSLIANGKVLLPSCNSCWVTRWCIWLSSRICYYNHKTVVSFHSLIADLDQALLCNAVCFHSIISSVTAVCQVLMRKSRLPFFCHLFKRQIINLLSWTVFPSPSWWNVTSSFRALLVPVPCKNLGWVFARDWLDSLWEALTLSCLSEKQK